MNLNTASPLEVAAFALGSTTRCEIVRLIAAAPEPVVTSAYLREKLEAGGHSSSHVAAHLRILAQARIVEIKDLRVLFLANLGPAGVAAVEYLKAMRVTE